MKRKASITLVMPQIAQLLILFFIMLALYSVYHLTVSENKLTYTEKVARDISNMLRDAADMEQGVRYYTLTEKSYDIQITPKYVIVSDKNVGCEEGCTYVVEHRVDSMQAGYLVPGTERICAVKTYRDGAPVIYLCDADGNDLRCNCEAKPGQAKPYTERFKSDCRLTLLDLDNYAEPLKPGEEVKEENIVSMKVLAENCQGTYLSPFGSPTRDWSYGKPIPDNSRNEEYTALRHKITYECVKKGKDVKNPADPNYCEELKKDREARTIDEPRKEITVEYICMGYTKEDHPYFLFDIVAQPADSKYPLDILARIQTQVGCGTKPTPIVCVGKDGRGYSSTGESYCRPAKEECGEGEYLCQRQGMPFHDLCVPEYYDSNCVPEKVFE